uniref:Secreted phosphoprotein 1 n=1 Tax=Labrus bergylta TaxID=56723 RepID=A0A3Q3M422_9LABR
MSMLMTTPNCDTMKVAVIFVLLFATVLCRPARKESSSESSEEVVRRPAAQPSRKQAVLVPQTRAAPVQQQAEAPVEVKSDSSATASTNTASVNSKDSEDSDDDDDETEESETEEDEDESDSSESGESSTTVPSTLTPVIVTEEPVPETTEAPIAPTIVTDEEASRGDSFGGYPSDYKSIIYVEDKSYQKVPGPYKSYEFVNTGKKMAYDMTEGNDVEKSLQVYKAIHVHPDLLEEDTSTPEVESQGLDASSGTAQDQAVNDRQAALPEEASASDATTSESSSTPEEEDESASTASDSPSASEESEDEESQSSEEATATPGAADSDSDESTESDSDEDGAVPDITTDVPVVITAK